MKIPFLLLFLCFFGVTKATTYYISPTGSDILGTGTSTNPWKTLSKATSTVTSSGNIIHVNAGTYFEILTCNLAPGVSLEGDGVTSVIKSTLTALYQPIVALVSSEGTNGNQHISNLKFDGSNLLTTWGILIRGRSNVSIYNCTVVDFMETGVMWSGRADGNGLAPAIYATGNSFHDNIVANCATADIGWGRGCFMFGGQQGMLIYNNNITNLSRPIGQGGWPIKNCNEGFTKDCKIYNNYLERPPYPYNFNGANNYWNFAIELFNESGLEIYGNTIKGSIDMNYQSKDIFAYSVYIHDNIIGQDNLGTGTECGVIFEFSTNTAIVENNIIKNASYGVYFTPRSNDAVTNLTIQKNLMYNVGQSDGSHMGFGIAMQTPEDGTVTAHNFFVQNNAIIASPGNNNASYGVRIPDGGPSTNIKIINNIIQGFWVECIRANPASYVDTLLIKNNNLYLNGNNNIPGFNGTPSHYTNSGNISTNPLFVSPTDYHLLGTSPCIDAGINVGLAYSGAAPDMNYTEYSGATNTPPTANAGADQTITLPTSLVSLSGSGTDPDGTVTGFTWTKIAGPAATITAPGSANTTVTGLVVGTYLFELKVTDNGGATGKDTMQVIVNSGAANIPPTANAGADQTITLPTSSVSLTGLGTDPDGTVTGFTWTKIAGPAATITTPGSGNTTVTGLVQGTYLFELKVTDNSGATGKDTMQVIVNAAAANIPPTAHANVDQVITLPTNSVSLMGWGTDPDGSIIGFTWTKIAGPAATITTPNFANTTVTGLIQGTYQFELTVSDNNGATGKDTMQVIVNAAAPPANIAPTANAGADQTITLPTSSVSLSGLGTDPDGTVTGFTWTKIAGPAATITTPNSANTTVTGLVQGTYQFELKVTDNNGATGKDTMQVIVNAAAPPANIAPTANAGADQTITLPTSSVSLTGSGTDPDGTVTGFTWTKISGPAATITSPGSANTTVTGLIAGVYKFELKVTDNNGATGKDTMQVTVNAAAPPPNIAPTANAGTDQTITLPASSISLSGSGTDPDGTVTGFTWTKIAGPAATITTPNSANTTVTGLVQGTYQFELKVTDNNGATGKDTMQVIVNAAAPPPNVAPTANAGADQTITLPTSSVSLSGSGTDPDGTVTGFTWTKISGPAATITSPGSANTTVTGLVQGTYQFELKVTDNNGATGKDTMQVTVNAAAPPPNVAPTANAGADQTITLPTSSVSLTGSGTDPDGTVTGFTWTKISGPTGGTITAPNSANTTVTGLVQGIYKFELKVTDNNGATGKDTMQVIVNAALNIPPTANAGADQNITLPTNSVSLSGSGTDPDGTVTGFTWTKIAGPSLGTITTPGAANTTVTGLVQGTYLFELKVTDNNGAIGKDTMQVIVNPVPNVPPTANAGADQNITLPTNSVNLNGSGTDPDGTITAYSWTKISGPTTGGTITNPAAASTSVTGLVAGIYKFELKVTDNNGATAKDTMQVVVFAPNVPPTANAGLNQSITLPTNTATLSGSGNDVDGTIISYKWTKLSGPAAGIITSSTTPVTTVTALAQGIYQFELKVTDNNGATATDIVQVTVNPENIAPLANAGPDQIITLPGNNVTLSGNGTDVDGTIVSYGWRQISGPPDKLTSINTASTVLKTLVEGNYTFEFTVTDNKGATGKDTVNVIAKTEVVPSQNVINVYPNPVVDVTTLDISTTTKSTMLVMITDMQGKNVYRKQLNPGTYATKEIINMSKLSTGMYLLTVYFNSQDKKTLKIVKN